MGGKTTIFNYNLIQIEQTDNKKASSLKTSPRWIKNYSDECF